MKIAICIPVHGETKARFTQSLARMIAHTLSARIAGPDGPIALQIETLIFSTSNLSFSRRRLVTAAFEWGADYILWADADHTFPSNALARLLVHGVQVVGVNYRRRSGDAPTASGFDEAGAIVPLEPKASGLEQVAHLGLGLCLIRADVFSALSGPMFMEALSEDGGSPIGEDVYFFGQVREAGIPIYVDHALSMEVGHIAEAVLGWAMDEDRREICRAG